MSGGAGSFHLLFEYGSEKMWREYGDGIAEQRIRRFLSVFGEIICVGYF